MKSYIVRICRHCADDPETLIGVVEDPENEERTPFKNLEELWLILNARKRGCNKQRVLIQTAFEDT